MYMTAWGYDETILRKRGFIVLVIDSLRMSFISIILNRKCDGKMFSHEGSVGE